MIWSTGFSVIVKKYDLILVGLDSFEMNTKSTCFEFHFLFICHWMCG